MAFDEAGMKALGIEVVVAVPTGSADKLNPGGLLPVAPGFVNKGAGWVALINALLTDCWPCAGGAAVGGIVVLLNP